MKLSKYIEYLQKLKDEHGDLKMHWLMISNFRGFLKDVKRPVVRDHEGKKFVEVVL